MSKSQAEEKRDERIAAAAAPNPLITFGKFLKGIALPFLRSKWKRSTAATSENRIRHHLLLEYQDTRLADVSLKGLQQLLNAKSGNALQEQRR